MKRRLQYSFLAVLLLVLAWVVARNFGDSPEIAQVFANQQYERLDVPDPTLQLDRLERIKKLEYKGGGEDIFVHKKAAPPPQQKVETPVVQQPPQPTGPPPLVPPFKFFGYAGDPATGKRRGFFTNGDDIWIVEEGQMIGRSFRLLKLGNANAEVEEVSSGRKATLPLEEQAAP